MSLFKELQEERIKEYALPMFSLLKEFCSDVVTGGGPSELARLWPDLLVTYNKACAILEEIRQP